MEIKIDITDYLSEEEIKDDMRDLYKFFEGVYKK